MLQSILKQKADEAFRNQALQQESQRIAIEQQRVEGETELRKAMLADRVRQQTEADVNKIAGDIGPQGIGMPVDQPVAQQLGQSPLGQSLMTPQTAVASAPIAQILSDDGQGSGPLKPAPGQLSLAQQAGQTPTPGGPTGRQTFVGTGPQQATRTLMDAQSAYSAAHPDVAGALAAMDPSERGKSIAENLKLGATPQKTEAVVRQNPRTNAVERMVNGQWVPVTGDLPPGAHVMTEPPPPQDHYGVQAVTNAEGSQGFVRINTQTGEVKPVDLGAGVSAGKPNQTLDTRLQSAKANLQVAGDIKKQLSDPAVQADLGPLMGRANGVMNIIGNPPDGYAKLAGAIHSLALSSLAVHGMRSAEAARQIQEDLSLIHTPAALANYIDGLTSFGQYLLLNNKQGSPSSSGFKVVEIK